MSSLIEQAALRLEQLRQAGVALPEMEPDAAPPRPGPPALPQTAQTTQTEQTVRTTQTTRTAPAARTISAAAAMAMATTDDGPASSRRVVIDLEALSAAGIVTPNAPRTHLADQYRVLKRPLIANAMGKGAANIAHGNLIMVTSALAGEGKSFTSINLAMSIAAELDHTVMLVDADVARPSVLRVLGLPPGPGLLDLLESKGDMASVLLKTNIDKLTIMPSGTPHPKATELLASESMTALLNDMATRYPDRIIIFDSPPLLLTTESRVLATNMGQIVVVVAAGRTLQATVQQALATIESCPVKMMVLNKARSDAQGAYGFGYGYAYGYGYGADGAEPQREA